MKGYTLLVRSDDGSLYFVGRRSSLQQLLEDIDLYQRDPIAAGHFFGVHVDAKGRVTWSDDWCAVVDAGIAGQIQRVFHPGHGDPYAQWEDYVLSEALATGVRDDTMELAAAS